ncbi:hypothetical protein CHUAL_004951 [Chamberlinius hualienensis]
MFSFILLLIVNLQCTSSEFIQEKFREFSEEQCNSFMIGTNSFSCSKLECLATCTDDCIGVSYNFEEKRCSTHKCQLTNTVDLTTINKLTDCYLKGDEFCSNNVTSFSVPLPDMEPDQSCISVPGNKVKLISIDLGAQHIINYIDIEVNNLESAKISFQTVLYFPTDPAIDVNKYAAVCSTATGNSPANQKTTMRIACSPCAIYGQYVMVKINNTQPVAQGDISVCDIKVTACSTKFF